MEHVSIDLDNLHLSKEEDIRGLLDAIFEKLKQYGLDIEAQDYKLQFARFRRDYDPDTVADVRDDLENIELIVKHLKKLKTLH